MTNKEQLEAVEKEIRRLCPELMELAEGCILILGGIRRDLMQKYDDEYLLKGEYPSEHEVISGAELNRRLDNYHSKIIGHDIGLESVLKVIEEVTHIKTATGYFEGTEDNPVAIKEDYRVGFDKRKLLYLWEMGQPLQNQKPETIEFLYNLLLIKKLYVENILIRRTEGQD